MLAEKGDFWQQLEVIPPRPFADARKIFEGESYAKAALACQNVEWIELYPPLASLIASNEDAVACKRLCKSLGDFKNLKVLNLSSFLVENLYDLLESVVSIDKCSSLVSVRTKAQFFAVMASCKKSTNDPTFTTSYLQFNPPQVSRNLMDSS